MPSTMNPTLAAVKLGSPFGWLPDGWHAGLCATLVIAAVALAVLLEHRAAPIKASVEDGILALEAPWTGQRAREVRKKLAKDCALQAAREHTALDFAFLVVYPLAMSLACAMLAATLAGQAGAIGMMIAWAVLLAAPLDAIENLAILRMLDGGTDGLWPQVSTVCASVKFALIVGGFGFIVVGTVMRIVQCWKG